MILPVTFRRAARAEFVEAAARYEAESPGLGAAFIAEIERCVARAAERPQLYAVIHNGMRRVTAERFPYNATSGRKSSAWSFWLSSMAAETLRFGSAAPDLPVEKLSRGLHHADHGVLACFKAAREEHGIPVESALRDMSVRDGGVDADADPVL